MIDDRELCEDCPYYDVQFEICRSPMGCFNEGVTDESEVVE